MNSIRNSKDYNPKTFQESHIFDSSGILGWIGGRRKKAILNSLSEVTRNKRKITVIDIGCGYGEIISEFPAGQKVGVDINFSALREAKQRNAGAFFVLCDVENLPFRPKTFDCVICSEVLEHVDSPEQLTQKIIDLTKIGGFLFITVPNELITTIGRFLLRKKPYKSPAHKSVFSLDKLRTLFPYSLVKKINIPFSCMPFWISTNTMVCFRKL